VIASGWFFIRTRESHPSLKESLEPIGLEIATISLSNQTLKRLSRDRSGLTILHQSFTL
jgi:hypothetical protein